MFVPLMLREAGANERCVQGGSRNSLRPTGRTIEAMPIITVTTRFLAKHFHCSSPGHRVFIKTNIHVCTDSKPTRGCKKLGYFLHIRDRDSRLKQILGVGSGENESASPESRLLARS
jgi:hypothetical protein